MPVAEKPGHSGFSNIDQKDPVGGGCISGEQQCWFPFKLQQHITFKPVLPFTGRVVDHFCCLPLQRVELIVCIGEIVAPVFTISDISDDEIGDKALLSLKGGELKALYTVVHPHQYQLMIGGELYGTGISLQADHPFLFPIQLVCDQPCRILCDEYGAIGQLVKFCIDYLSFERNHGVRVFK